MKKWIDKKKTWLYETKAGRIFLNLIIKRKPTSKLAGFFANSILSKKIIKSFARDYNININPETSPFIIPKNGFKTINELFTRNYKKENINFSKARKILCSPAEGYLNVQKNIDSSSLIQAKGFTYFINELLGENNLDFEGGTLLRIRLTPREYHWFHYLDNAKIIKIKKIKGYSYTAEDISINHIPKMFCRSIRDITLLKTKNFGNVVYIEIGSTFVSSIFQNNKTGDNVKRGEKKGCFKFGGSTVILIFQKDKIKLDKKFSFLYSSPEKEVYVGLGEILGKKVKSII
jgi:phosphatidylserine decarboxylase